MKDVNELRGELRDIIAKDIKKWRSELRGKIENVEESMMSKINDLTKRVESLEKRE